MFQKKGANYQHLTASVYVSAYAYALVKTSLEFGHILDRND